MSELDRPDSGQDDACLHARLAEARACLTCGPATERELAAISVPAPLARVLAEVAAEVQRQDEAGDDIDGVRRGQRADLIDLAADCLRSVLAIDQRAGDDR